MELQKDTTQTISHWLNITELQTQIRFTLDNGLRYQTKLYLQKINKMLKLKQK